VIVDCARNAGGLRLFIVSRPTVGKYGRLTEASTLKMLLEGGIMQFVLWNTPLKIWTFYARVLNIKQFDRSSQTNSL